MDDDLETAANKFKEWRGNRRHYRYPGHFWDEIKQFAKHYPLSDIANAFGINLQYLRQKIPHISESLPFAPIKVVSLSSTLSIEFIDRNSQPMIFRLQATHEELVRIILSLSSHAL